LVGLDAPNILLGMEEEVKLYLVAATNIFVRDMEYEMDITPFRHFSFVCCRTYTFHHLIRAMELWLDKDVLAS